MGGASLTVLIGTARATRKLLWWISWLRPVLEEVRFENTREVMGTCVVN